MVTRKFIRERDTSSKFSQYYRYASARDHVLLGSCTMADNSESFTPDVFLQALKELQKEKQAHEQILKQTREEKKLLEYRLQEADNSYSSVKNKKMKMNEMKEVAECKLAKTQEMFERMTTKNGVKTATLEELMNNISEEQMKQSQQIMELENKLDLLANQFRHAKSFYADVSMDKEITNLKLKRDGLESETESQEDCIVQLDQKLELLDIAKQHNEPLTQGVDEWTRAIDTGEILLLFEEERDKLHVYTEQQSDQLQLVHQENDNLLLECRQMEQTDIKANTES